MCADSSDETTAEVCADSLWSEVTIAERVEHSSVRAQESAPAHTDSCEHCNGVAVNPTMLDEAWNQAQRSSYGTESSDRERYEVWVMETEEPLEYEVYLVSKPRKKLYTLISCACVTAVCCRTEGEYHHESRDDEHARDDGNTYLYTASTTVEHSIEHADLPREM